MSADMLKASAHSLREQSPPLGSLEEDDCAPWQEVNWDDLSVCRVLLILYFIYSVVKTVF